MKLYNIPLYLEASLVHLDELQARKPRKPGFDWSKALSLAALVGFLCYLITAGGD